MNSIQLYDFEGNIPDIIAVAFPNEMNVGTVNEAPDLQKPRPRVDMQFRAIGSPSPPRVINSPSFIGTNLIPPGALYTRSANTIPNYVIPGTATGSMYFYLPGQDEAQLVFVYPGFTTRVITQQGLIAFDGTSAQLNASLTPDGPSGPFPPLPITAIFRPCNPGRAIAAYEGDLELDLITEPSGTGKMAHSAYRAAVRQTLELDRLRNAVNLNTSPYQVDFIYCTGASDTIKTDKGYETSHMSYRIQFSIKQDAFNQLAAS